MAKIESYVLANAPLSGSDKLIGTDTAHNNATKNFSINELITFITDSGVYVPYTGATANVDLNNNNLTGVVTFSSNDISNNNLVDTYDLNISNSLYLSAYQGALGEVLTSQGSGNPPIWSAASTGAQGIQGPVGPQGPIGPVGPAGLNWQGLWVSGTSYLVDDAVGYAGASWFCINATSGTTPPDVDTTNWALLAAQGAQGPIGPTGAQGPTGATGPQGASGNNTLQQVLAFPNLISGRNFQGTGSGTGNSGFSVNGFGTNVATNNSGTNVNAFGPDAADENTSNNVNALGSEAAAYNSANNINALGLRAAYNNYGINVNALGQNASDNNSGYGVNAFGYYAGQNNTFNNVNLFGYYATASANDQLVMTNDLSFNARISYTNLTADRLYELPNNSGTIALTSDISFPYLVYTALISYDGFSITENILQNTLGVTLNWSIPFNGTLRATAASGTPFTLNKTWLTSGALSQGSSNPYIVASAVRSIAPTTQFEYRFFLHDGTITGTPSFTNYSIEIRVYP